MARKFYMRNKYGQIWELNSTRTGFFASPAGLGFSKEAQYISIGSRFLTGNIKDAQMHVTGIIKFGRDGAKTPYEVQHEFIQFTELSDSLELVYETPAGKYYRAVDLIAFGKTEKAAGLLSCDVDFACKTLFYNSSVDRFIVTRADGELRYSFRYPARFNDYANRKVLVNNDGHVPAAFTAEIFGYTEYPRIVALRDKEEIARVEFDTILEAGEKLYFSTVDGNIYCYRQDEDGEISNFAYNLDINNENFFKLPLGETELMIASDTAVTNRTIFEIYRYYRTV